MAERKVVHHYVPVPGFKPLQQTTFLIAFSSKDRCRTAIITKTGKQQAVRPVGAVQAAELPQVLSEQSVSLTFRQLHAFTVRFA